MRLRCRGVALTEYAQPLQARQYTALYNELLARRAAA
jgi:hypothetical protein